jgi:hypothetical protein
MRSPAAVRRASMALMQTLQYRTTALSRYVESRSASLRNRLA